MAIIPQNKQWTQTNDGDSLGNVNATWGIDFNDNRGSVKASSPTKKLFDDTEIAFLEEQAAAITEFNSNVWGSMTRMVKSATTGDLADGSTWARDTASGSPQTTSTSDSVVFDDMLLVQENNGIASFDGNNWDDDWWNNLAGTPGLDVNEETVLTVGASGRLYVVEGGDKVHAIPPSTATDTTPKIAGNDTGTLDFSATRHKIKNGVATSSRLFYGTEDQEGENAVIIEWDMGAQSISANRIHEMGVKRVLAQAVWNDTPIAILSDGNIKYFNGSAYVDFEGAHLPELGDNYDAGSINKNGWSIIDNLPHFLINPTADRDEVGIQETTKGKWSAPAGVYCLDPKIGLYNRFPLSDGTNPHFKVSSVGALFARKTKNTKFFASYTVWTDNTTELAYMACEDGTNTLAGSSWLVLQPFESVRDFIKKLTLVHKRLGTGDTVDVYYRRHDEDGVRLSGNWLDTTTFNSTEDDTGIEVGHVGFVKGGSGAGFFSTVKSVSDGATSSITFNDAASVTANDSSVLEFVNFKHMGTVTNTGVEVSDLTIPQPQRSRQVWVWLKLNKSAGNDLQLDYLLTE